MAAAWGGKGKGGGIKGFIGGAGGLLAAGVAAGLAMEAIAIWEDTNATSTEQAQTAHDNVNAQLEGNRKTADSQIRSGRSSRASTRSRRTRC